MSIGVYTYGIYQTVRAYLNWKDLDTPERVAVVTNTLQIAANIFNDLVQFRAAQTLTTATASLNDVMQAAGAIQDAMDLQRLTTACDKIGVQVDVALGDLGAPGLAGGGAAAGGALAAAEDAADVAARWMNVAKVTELVARGLTIVALAAGCVATGFQIASDFDSDQPAVIKAFDILSEISNGVAFIVEGVVGIAALVGAEVCSAIPIIGTVAAVIGIIIAFVSMFIHRKPPPTPQEVFVSEQSQPFVTGLVVPDQAWVTAQQAEAKHLGGDGTSTLAPVLV